MYQRYSNTAIAFIKEHCEEVAYIPADKSGDQYIPAQGFILVNDIYPKYKEWCVKNLLGCKANNAFTKALTYSDWSLETGQKEGRGGSLGRSIRGIDWKEGEL